MATALGNTLALDGNGSCTTTGTTSSCTASLTTSNKNTVLILSYDSAFSSSGCDSTTQTSSPSLTWTLRGHEARTGTEECEYYATWTSSGSISVTCAEAGAARSVCLVFGIDGADLGNVFDSATLPCVNNGSGTSATCTVSTNSGNVMLVALVGIGSNSAVTLGSGFSSVGSATCPATGTTREQCDEYEITTSIQSGVTVSMGITTSSPWTMIVDAIVRQPALSNTPAFTQASAKYNVPEDKDGMAADNLGTYTASSDNKHVYINYDNSGTAGGTVYTVASGLAHVSDPEVVTAHDRLVVGWVQAFTVGTATHRYIEVATNTSESPFSWNSPINASNPYQNASPSDFELAASGSYVYAAYINPLVDNTSALAVSVSSNGGSTWSAHEVGNTTFVHTQEVNMVVSGNYIYIVTESINNSTLTHYMGVAVSSNNGASWTVKYYNDLAGTSGGEQPREPILAVSANGNLYVAYRWYDSAGHNQINFDVSTNHGSTWAVAKNVSLSQTSGGLSREPWIAAYGNNVYISYRDDVGTTNYQVYFTYSHNNGTTWSTPVRLNTIDSGVNSSQVGTGYYSPEVAATSNGIVGVLWNLYYPGNNTYTEFLSVSESGGAGISSTISSTQFKLLGSGSVSNNQMLVAANGVLYADWAYATSGTTTGFGSDLAA